LAGKTDLASEDPDPCICVIRVWELWVLTVLWGGGIPIATGAAFASKYKKSDQVTACFFGEGATNEGTFHEALNMASIQKLPVVFICENNGWAEFTPQEIHMPVQHVSDRVAGYDIPGVLVPNDFDKIFNEAGKAVDRARKGNGPSFIEVKSSRWYGHFVGDAQKYRNKEEVKKAMKSDCIINFEQTLLSGKVLVKNEIEKIKKNVNNEIEEAVEFARTSPLPEGSELMEGLYV